MTTDQTEGQDQTEQQMGGDVTEGGDAQPPHESPTVAALPPSRRPPPGIACVTCPSSLWHLSGKEVQCYCRVMYLLTWTTSKPGNVTICDGPTLMEE